MEAPIPLDPPITITFICPPRHGALEILIHLSHLRTVENTMVTVETENHLPVLNLPDRNGQGDSVRGNQRSYPLRDTLVSHQRNHGSCRAGNEPSFSPGAKHSRRQ